MRARLTFLFLHWLLPITAFIAALSILSTLVFRDARRGPYSEYLTGYLIPRFLDFFAIFAAPVPAIVFVVSGLLVYELTRCKP